MNSSLLRRLTTLLSAALFLPACATVAQGAQLTVAAGDWERRQTLVVCTLPPKTLGLQLRDRAGRTSTIQIEASGYGSFIIEYLPKGATKSFEVISGDSKQTTGPPAVRVIRMGKKLKLLNADKTVLEYQTEPSDPPPGIDSIFKRGGYIHPVLTPSGRLVTDDYPSNHKHHHGIWFPWTKTEFEGRSPDFWNMGEGKGRVEFVSLDKTWAGPVMGGFEARHRFVDLTGEAPQAVLNERWEVRAYAVNAKEKPYWMFDLVSSQQCASSSPLTLLKFYYGGLGFRGHWDWNGTNNTFYLTSEGETDRVKGNTTRARWCHISGMVDGERAGIAILCHPENFRAPQPMRLHPSEPFFCYAPSQLDSFEIKPGDTYISRYRFIVHDGAPDRAELDRLWNDYAHPPEVKVEK